MPHYPYLIVGGGVAGQAAIQGIRELDAKNPIGVLGQEAHKPYKRPPLSKGLWKGEALDYEAVGLVDSRLKTVSFWKKPNEEGIIYYLQDGRVRGALMWNVWKYLDTARKLIAEPGPFEPADLAGRVPWTPAPRPAADANLAGGEHGQ